MPEEILPNQQNNLSAPQELQAPQSQPVVKNEKSTGKSPILKYFLIGVIAVLVIAGLAGAYVLGTQKSNNPTSNISPTISSNENSTDDWKKYNLSTINLEFQLPNELAGELNEEIQDSKDLPPNAARGTVYCAYINKNDMSLIPKAFAGGALACSSEKAILTIGGASPDLEVGRSGAYSDFQGFIKNGENYEVRFVADKTFPTTDIKTSYFKNENDVEILKIYGQNSEGMSIWPNEGKILVIINTNNPTYRGISFEVDTSKISEKTLDQILSTFKFTVSASQSSKDTSDWKTYTNSKEGITISYPSDWKLDSNAPSDALLQFNYPPTGILPRFSLFRNFAGDWCNGIPSTNESTIKLSNGTSAKKWDCKQTIVLMFSQNNEELVLYTDNITKETYPTVNKVINSLKFN